jgi:hypothetical protein
MSSDLGALLTLRALQYKRLSVRLGKRIRSASPTTVFFILLLIGGLVLLYLELPAYLEGLVERSAYPVDRLAALALFVLFFFLIYRRFTSGIRYPPFYLAQGDLVLLLPSPIDQRVVLFARLARSFLTSGLGVGIALLLLSPFLPLIWPGLEPGMMATLGIEIWLFLSVLANLQWFVFHFRALRTVARAVRRAVSIILGLSLAALFTLWAVNPGFFQIEATTAVAEAPSLPTFPHLPVLIGLGLLALGASLATFRTMAGADIERIANYSFFVGESLRLTKGMQLEEVRRLAARMSEGKKSARMKIPGYGYGGQAIAWKSATVLVRQG